MSNIVIINNLKFDTLASTVDEFPEYFVNLVNVTTGNSPAGLWINKEHLDLLKSLNGPMGIANVPLEFSALSVHTEISLHIQRVSLFLLDFHRKMHK